MALGKGTCSQVCKLSSDFHAVAHTWTNTHRVNTFRRKTQRETKAGERCLLHLIVGIWGPEHRKQVMGILFIIAPTTGSRQHISILDLHNAALGILYVCPRLCHLTLNLPHSHNLFQGMSSLSRWKTLQLATKLVSLPHLAISTSSLP